MFISFSSLVYQRGGRNKLDEFEVPVFFDLENLRKTIGIDKKYFYKVLYFRDNLYKQISIPKRNGKQRKLDVPELALKGMQRWILDNILYKVPVESNATGFIPSKSIISNAAPHLKKRYIVKMDIKDFFPSITFNKIKNIFLGLGMSESISDSLTNICTFQNQLPQGAPTSPYLANLVCIDMDKRISALCKKKKLTYTRYADDITISGDESVSWVISIVNNIAKDYNFYLNDDKTVILKPGDRKRVTGIIVNEKLSVPKSISKDLRKNIYFIKKYGLKNHFDFLINSLEDEKQEMPKFLSSTEHYILHLYGTANYIKMIEVEKGITLFNQLNSILSESENIPFNRRSE